MVFLSSDGGYLRDGYAAAQLFNEHNVETIIYGNQSCSSSCATAFLGAKIRSMRDRATLSFHSPYTIRGTQAHCSTKDEQGDLKAFFQRHINPEDGEFLFERTMDHCSGNDLWDINPDAAEILGVTTLDSNFDRHKAIDDIPDEQYIELVRSRLKQSFPNIGSSGRTPINSSHSGLSCTFTLHIYASDDFRMFPSSEEGDCQGRPPYFGHAIQDALREISIPIRKSDLASPPRKLQITLTGEYLLSS